MATVLRILAWQLGLLAALAIGLALAAAYRLDAVAFGLPALFAVWVLFQGALFARRRWAVWTCATVSAALFVLQVALLAFIIWWNRGFDATNTGTTQQVLILWTVAGGAALLVWFLRAKRAIGGARIPA